MVKNKIKFRAASVKTLLRAVPVALFLTGPTACLALAGVGEQASSPTGASQPSSLQVTEKNGRFTLIADHASVQRVLTALFEQGDRQFAPDSSVTGDVTMRLIGQPFRVVLDAVCVQTFLRYRYDAPSGIFRFEQDQEAIKAAFARLRGLNGQLRQQLRSFGLDVPDVNATTAYNYGYRAGSPNNDALNGASELYKNGVLGGDIPPGSALNAGKSLSASTRANVNRAKPYATTGIKPNFLAEQTVNQFRREATGAAGRAAGGGNPAGANADADKNDLSLSLDDSAAYQQMVSQNNLVSFNIARDKPEPVYSVLQQLAAQANVPIVIDPAVPNGSKFRINGSVPPRPLPEALNLLAPSARLEWRWIGSRIFVTTAPEFQIFYGESLAPRATLGRPSQTQQPQLQRAVPSEPAKSKP